MFSLRKMFALEQARTIVIALKLFACFFTNCKISPNQQQCFLIAVYWHKLKAADIFIIATFSYLMDKLLLRMAMVKSH